MDATYQLYQFSGYWQIGVCTFAFAALLAIWYHITSKENLPNRDPGLLWLAVAVLVWSFSGIVDVMQAAALQSSSETSELFHFEGYRSLLSILNSAFILLALPRFRHSPKLAGKMLRSESWHWLVMLSFGFSIILTLMMLFGWLVPLRYNFIYTIDFIYAVFTLFFLGLVLWTSFERRDLKVLSYLSVITIACTLLAQVLKLSDPLFHKILLNCVFKSVLIMLFFALALSWIEELSSKPAAHLSSQFHLAFSPSRIQGKTDYQIILALPPLFKMNRISLTEKNYLLLQQFAEKLKIAPNAGWLEIQPKSNHRVGHDYDIKDYNQINRLLDNMLQANEDLTASTELRKTLKETLFTYGKQRQIRLRIPAENIIL